MGVRLSKDSRPLRVLVVEDHRDEADAEAELLRRLGYLVVVACDGATALKAAKRFRPHVVLLDVSMPEMDGHEVARRIRACSAFPMTIVAVTGGASAEDRTRTAADGIDFHLAKPTEISVLKYVLAKVESGSIAFHEIHRTRNLPQQNG